MSDLKKRIRTLEQKHAERGNQFAIVFTKPGDDAHYNADGSVYKGAARTRIIMNWAIRDA